MWRGREGTAVILKEHESICIWTEIWLTIHEWRFANSTLFPLDPPAAPSRCQAALHRCPRQDLRDTLSSNLLHTTSARALAPPGPSWAERSRGTRHCRPVGTAGLWALPGSPGPGALQGPAPVLGLLRGPKGARWKDAKVKAFSCQY